MGDKEDYLTSYRVFFENFAATVNPEDQLPVHIAGYTITEAELPGEVLYWTTQYLSGKQCPLTLMTPLRRIILDDVRVASKKYPNEFGYKSDESVYIALRLMQAVTARVNDICLRYLDNSRLDTLPPPPPLAQRDLKTVSCATKNSRRVMEDRHVEIGNLEALFGIETTEPTSFYAVYDGHAGSAAATYCAAHLHQYLVESPHFTKDLTRAMHDAFLRTDAEFIRKSNQERASGGSTAVAVTVRGRSLLAAWAGDSLALLAKRMRLMQLVRPHKPSRQDEKDRIEASGGTVMYWGTWRVNGQLAVSRAIGDAQYKPHVIARPEIATVDLDGDEDFVVVACDGLWDFVSEDDVALAVYRQLAADPDDLKAVTKRLVIQAKRQGSSDNISIIVVFLKDPRDIAADNCPPMDLGLDNALANVPPFAGEAEACKRPAEAAAAVVEADADNGVDNSDSDSEDLGPETAVDAEDLDADARMHEPAAPTPPAHTVEEGHVDGALVDNVAESGDDSEDEWNYFKGEGEPDNHNASEDQEPDEHPLSETPCQDNSAWESSSVDMNSSPLNPDAPVFIPGSVAGSDVLLAESPRKPLPMDDIELPDVKQFETEAIVRPAELLDLDNCDQLNGHHNVSIESTDKEHLNGNDTSTMDSLGFGFNVAIEPDKVKDSSLIQDFERIQKDTTDFCNIQVFQTQTETNPFAVEGNDELFERLKNKERDPMSMSFYQEKDDDTCERISNKNDSHVDLNAVQMLPDSDDDDLQTNGVCEEDKENISPSAHTDPFAIVDIHEPNNDIMRFDERTDNLSNNIVNIGQGDNCMDYNVTNTSNIQSYPNIEFETGNIPQDNNTVLQTDTPESHKLLFEQIPEIPDGKSSELGFTNDDNQDPSESEKDTRAITPQDETSQDIEMESKEDISPCEESPQLLIDTEIKEDNENDRITPLKDSENEIICETEFTTDTRPELALDNPFISPTPHEDIVTAEIVQEDEKITENPNLESQQIVSDVVEQKIAPSEFEAPEIRVQEEEPVPADKVSLPAESPASSPLPAVSPAPLESSLPDAGPAESPLPDQVPASPLPTDAALPRDSPLPTDTSLPRDSPVPTDASLPRDSPLPVESPIPTDASLPRASPLPVESPIPTEASLPRDSPLPVESPIPTEEAAPVASPLPVETEQLKIAPEESHSPALSPAPEPEDVPQHEDEIEVAKPIEPEVAREPSPFPAENSLPHEPPAPIESDSAVEPPTVAPVSPAPEAPLVVEEVPLATPDIVPEARAADLVTDIDVGVPESRATEICVPVTCEIRPEDGELPPTGATPPPTPAVDHTPPVDPLAAAVAAGAAVAAAATVAAVAKTKTPAPKKTPTTPTAKSATPRSATKPSPAPATTPASAAKRTAAPATPKTPSSAARPASARTPTAKAAPSLAPRPASATKPSPVTARPPAPRPPPSARTAAPALSAKPAPAASAKPAPKSAAPPAPRAARAAPAPKPASGAPKPAGGRAPPAKAAAPRPAPAPAAPRPAPAARPAPRPTTAPAARAAPATTAAAAAKPKRLVEKKPLANGDVKETKPAAPRVPITARAAPRPAPRQPAPAPPTTRTAAPRAAQRAPALDKQSKDLANKRITAKAAPPRTNAIKAPASTKSAVPKAAAKKAVEAPLKGAATENGLTNGAEELTKPPPSPPAHDNALLPDVIA